MKKLITVLKINYCSAMKKIITLIFILFCSFSIESAYAQFDYVFIGGGITGTNIFESNLGWKPIANKTGDSTYQIGGSFDGIETGILIKGETNLDKDGNFMLPFSFEFVWLNAFELVPQRTTKDYYSHYVNLQKISTGLNYFFYTFPLQNVKPFIGFECKGVFINSQEMERKIVFTQTNTSKVMNATTKDPVFRLGAEIKGGFRGEITENFYLNFSGGIEWINLIGRDDARGELLTPFPGADNKESIVPNYHITFLVEYKF